MFKKLSQKVKKPSKKDEKVDKQPQGKAVPYKEPETGEDISPSHHDKARGAASPPVSPTSPTSPKTPTTPKFPGAEGGVPGSSGALLCQAARKGDIDNIRQLLKTGMDVNDQDQEDTTALVAAAATGHSKTVRYLLLHGADLDVENKSGAGPLHAALDGGHVGCVGVLLDYMHSVDNRPRDAFVILRARRKSDKSFFVEKVDHSGKLHSFTRRGVDMIQLLISHGQMAEDLSIFLYSVLDVPVEHAFFLNTLGDLNMKNFQRFETKVESLSLTVLNTFVRIIEASGYTKLRSLILVSCDLGKMTLDGLVSLELLDVRYNKLETLPTTIKQCQNLKTIRCSHNNIRRLPREIGLLSECLLSLDCSFNSMKRFTSNVVRLSSLRYLLAEYNSLLDLPVDIGLLTNLEELVVNNNKLSQLPMSISTLSKLKRIVFHSNPLSNIPVDFSERAQEVRQYLKALQNDPIANRSIKLVLVGQEGVGKTTLLKALRRHLWINPLPPHVPKTEGIDVKEIKLDELTLRCFDCGGDVDFNETHNFFITQGALYLTCFNLSEYTRTTVERSSFLLGRLQLWLQYIYTKVPNARVLIVGTHADDRSLNRDAFEQIWDQLRSLLVSAREHHHAYFGGRDCVSDCLLCQPDSRCLRRATGTTSSDAGYVNLGMEDQASLASEDDETSLNEGPARVVCFPHIVGYYEVSSTKAVGNENKFNLSSNKSIENLKDAVKEISMRLIKKNPQIPRKWDNCRQSFQNFIEMNPDDCVTTMDEVAKIAAAQGITDRTDLVNMLHFLKAQGHILFFPKSDDLKNLVVLDPEWLAKIFSSVVSFKDTGINLEGFIDRKQLNKTWSHVETHVRDKMLSLLRYFGLCIPIQGTNMELFPCKLPLGEPDDQVWPSAPLLGERQVTYTITFPSLIPPPLFSDLIVTVYRHRAPTASMDENANYFANLIVDAIKLDKIGCRNCDADKSGDKFQDAEYIHKVLIELIPYNRMLQISIRGRHPCCMIKRANMLLNKVVGKFEGLGGIDLDTILCPGCYMQKERGPHRFSAKILMGETEPLTCSNGHKLGEGKKILQGHINETYFPNATIRPKMERNYMDYSGCPKYFILLPVNKNGLSFDEEQKLVVSTMLMDGHACHLLCEFPDGYHLTSAPGYRINKPDEFMAKFGTHCIRVLRLLSYIKDSSVVAGFYTKLVSKTIDEIIKDLKTKFQGIKDIPTGTKADTLVAQINAAGLDFEREDLRRALNVADKPDSFGALRRMRYNDQMMWLCRDHYKQMRILSTNADLSLTGVEPSMPSHA